MTEYLVVFFFICLLSIYYLNDKAIVLVSFLSKWMDSEDLPMNDATIVTPEMVALGKRVQKGCALRLETVKVRFGHLIIEVPSAFAKYFPKA